MLKATNNSSKTIKKTSIQMPNIPLPSKNNLNLNASFIQCINYHKNDSATTTSTKKSIDHEQQALGIKKWRIGNLLGQGTSGRVYRALNIKTGILAAVKKIYYLNNDENLEESRNELSILSSISHFNVVTYIEDYQLQNETWIFMEFLSSTLQRFYKSFGVPPYETYIIFARQIIQGLEYLHRLKIVHRDLKCSNILMDSKSTIKISDFGCSQGFQKTFSLINYEKNGLKTLKGSVFWMSPELINQNIYTRKSDIWSLGCTLLQLATGQPPWHQKHFQNELQALYYIGQQNEIPFIPANLHENIIELIVNCLNRNSDNRKTTEDLLKLKIFQQKSQ